jgi:hypothetical protein
MLSRGLEYFRQSWNTFVQGWNASTGLECFDRVGMLPTVLEYLCTGLICVIEGWNAFDRVGIHAPGLECFRQSWNTLVQSWIAF